MAFLRAYMREGRCGKTTALKGATKTWARSEGVTGDFSIILFSFADFVTGLSFS